MTETNILTAWRTGVKTHLATNLQGGQFEIRDGERDGPVTDAADGKIGVVAVWIPDLGELPSDVAYVTPPMIVRAWIATSRRPPKKAVPLDPSDVEQLMSDLLMTLQQIETTLMPPERNFYFRVTGVTPDYEDRGVEAILTSFIRRSGLVYTA